MKISLLCFDLSHNCLSRTYALAQVLKKKHDIEIIGPTFGKGIWEPCHTDEFPYKRVKGCDYPSFAFSAQKILKYIDGDVVYAFKPRPTSYGLGLIKKFKGKLPLILDIEDWEIGFFLHSQESKGHLLLHSLAKRMRAPNNFFYTLLMEHLTWLSDDITTASRFLQKKFGGVLVPHGRDTNIFNPDRFDSDSLRKEWKTEDAKLIVFFGTPHPYKGLEDLVSALGRLDRKDVKLMIVGGEKSKPFVKKLLAKGQNLIILIGPKHFSEAPMFLSMADLVVIPQRKSPATLAQVPAKIYEAMAMAKPVIGTRVSDIPEILDGCGLIVEPGNVDQLAEKISFILENEGFARELGKKARKKCVDEYSYDAMEKTLRRIFLKYE